MDITTKQIIKNMLGSLVRWLLVFVGAWLVKKGIVTDEQSQAFIRNAEPVVIGGLIALVALGWSLWQKRHVNNKVEMALNLPQGTPRSVLEAKEKV